MKYLAIVIGITVGLVAVPPVVVYVWALLNPDALQPEHEERDAHQSAADSDTKP